MCASAPVDIYVLEKVAWNTLGVHVMELPCLEDAIPKTIDGLSNIPAMYLNTFSHLFVGSEFADEVCEDGHIVGYVH